MTNQAISFSTASLVICLAGLAFACDTEDFDAPAEDLDAPAEDFDAPAEDLDAPAEGSDPESASYAGPEPTPVAGGDCCTTDSSPGCVDASVEACVCAADSYCCTTAWDALCVSEVESLGCGSCDTAYCCAAETTPGCVLPSVESCVCAVDSYCCTTAWDATCTNEVESLGCGSCAMGWAVGIGDSQSETVEPSGAVATDASGNVYVLGTFYSATIDLGGGPQARQGYSDVFLVSFAADGSYRWSRRIGGDSWDYGRGVGVDGSGNVYVTGESEGTLDLGGGSLPASAGTRDLFVGSYTSTGTHRWSQRHGAAATSLLAGDLAVDAAGNLVVVGRLDGSVSLGGSVLTDAGSTDMFVLALDNAGVHRWSRALGGTGSDAGTGVAVDSSGGAVITGHFSGSVDFGTGVMISAGSSDGATVRLQPNGSTDWARRYGSTSIDIAQDVALDAQGRTYMIGTFAGTVNLGDGPRTAAGSSEVLLAGYGPTGILLWSRRVGGGGLDYGRGITIDNDYEVVATGSFFGTAADFGGAALTGAGGYDVFLASYSANDGAHRWSTRFGTAATEEGYDLSVAPSGSVAMVGTFASTLPVADTTLSSAGGSDVFVASLLP
ncbi:SBBP repeat-containing protein [Enhygromyxa salina]|uniref:Beta-propeller repeat protein n=1 Tax=Enhygromyxa salina TaxID=215803 RepID=A0A2S9XTW0_9BACT|nr:SBBP repeat-containing protein [Enhygromyxa salina]PRP96317.1 Beta-propeller repeat protein [Enhygromyxa salina]